jgi:hypothetical protein
MTPLNILNIVLGLMMLGFTAVQYNDPDVPQWVLLYIIPALWMYAVTFRLQGVLRSSDLMRLLWASVLFYIGTVIYYWPTMPNFWLKEVWIVEETAREGMGLMIALAVMLVAVLNTQLPSAERRANTLTPTAKAQRT